MKKTRVIILFGGRSAEHEVSLLSARNVFLALDRNRFDPLLVGIDKQGHWRIEPEKTLLNATGDPRMLKLVAAGSELTVPVHPESAVTAVATVADETRPVLASDDVVFPVLHGTYGEDGTVQGLLELADVAYVGPGHLGSAIGMDKDVAKRLLAQAGIPVVPWRMVTAHAMKRDPTAGLARAGELGFPAFVKPANAGSSVGVSKVKSAGELGPAVRTALSYDTKVLVEAAVNAREIECAVLGNDEAIASMPAEIVVHHKDGFYSYDAKYVDADGADAKIPADIFAGAYRPRARPCRRDFPRAGAGGHGARGFLPRPRPRRPLRERGQHHPRIHRHLDVSQDVGSLGGADPRARKPPPRPRRRAPRLPPGPQDTAVAGGRTTANVRIPRTFLRNENETSSF